MKTYGGSEPTPVGDEGDAKALRGDPVAGIDGGRGTVLPGPLHALGAGGDGAPLGGREAAGAGIAVPRDRPANGRVDDDRDPGGALAEARRGRLSDRARAHDLLRVAVPVKGRLREP